MKWYTCPLTDVAELSLRFKSLMVHKLCVEFTYYVAVGLPLILCKTYIMHLNLLTNSDLLHLWEKGEKIV